MHARSSSALPQGPPPQLLSPATTMYLQPAGQAVRPTWWEAAEGEGAQPQAAPGLAPEQVAQQGSRPDGVAGHQPVGDVRVRLHKPLNVLLAHIPAATRRHQRPHQGRQQIRGKVAAMEARVRPCGVSGWRSAKALRLQGTHLKMKMAPSTGSVSAPAITSLLCSACGFPAGWGRPGSALLRVAAAVSILWRRMSWPVLPHPPFCSRQPGEPPGRDPASRECQAHTGIAKRGSCCWRRQRPAARRRQAGRRRRRAEGGPPCG